MADAVAVAVTKAVVEQLEGATLSQPINPIRSDAAWDVPLESDDTLLVGELLVDVVTVQTSQKAEPSARGMVNYTIPVDIAVRYKFGVDDQDDDTNEIDLEEIDSLKLLVQDIFELFIMRELTSYLPAVWETTEILVCPLKKHLRELRQFTGIVRTTFRVDKEFTP